MENATKLARKADHDMGWFENSLHPKSDRTTGLKSIDNTCGFTSTRKGASEALPKSWQIHSPALGIIFMLLGKGQVVGFTARMIGFVRFVAGEKRWGKILTQPYSSEKKLNEILCCCHLEWGQNKYKAEKDFFS